MTTSDSRPTGTKFRRPLTSAEMARIEAAVRSGGPAEQGPAAGLMKMWDIILGEAEGLTYAVAVASGQGLHPRDYAIPREQAEQLVAMLKGTRSSRVQRSVGLTWRLDGPASYDPED